MLKQHAAGLRVGSVSDRVKAGNCEDKTPAWAEADTPAPRCSLHRETQTASSQCCTLAAEHVPRRAVGSLRCASADPLSRPCYVGHRFPPTISYPIRSAVNTVDRTPHMASEVRCLINFDLFAPMSRIWDQKRCLSSFEKHCRMIGF